MPRPLPLLFLAAALAPTAHAAGDRDLPMAQPLALLSGSSGTAVSFSRDGTRLLTAGPDNRGEGDGPDSAQVWDAATLRPITPPLPHGAPIHCAQLSPNGKTLLTAGGKEVRVWDAATGRRLYRLMHESRVYAAAFSPDGRRVATGDKDVRVWDVVSGEVLLKLPLAADVAYLTYGPQGDRILTLAERKASVWDAGTGNLIARRWDKVDHSRCEFIEPPPASFSPDGRRVVTTQDDHFDVWDAATGRSIFSRQRWEPHLTGFVASPVFSPDGSRLAVPGLSAVSLFDPATELPVGNKVGPVEAQSADFTPDGHQLVVTNAVGLCYVYDVRSARRVLWYGFNSKEEGTPVAAVSPDGKRLAVGFRPSNATAILELPP